MAGRESVPWSTMAAVFVIARLCANSFAKCAKLG